MEKLQLKNEKRTKKIQRELNIAKCNYYRALSYSTQELKFQKRLVADSDKFLAM